jgi:hypothetical protein
MNDAYVEAIRQQTDTLAGLIRSQSDQRKDTDTALAEVLSQIKQNNNQVKAAAAAHTGTLLHGPGGLFNSPGLDQALISLHVKSKGLGQLLPAFPSVDTNPFFGFITGFGEEEGSEPVNPCDDAPTGYMKSGTLTAKFGHVARDTKTIRLPDTIKKLHRGDFTDLMLVNSVMNEETRGMYYPQDLTEAGFLDMVTKAEQVIAGINMERKLSNLLWNGDATVATAQEGYVEFPGLDSQIATGQVDAELNVAIPSADSIIMDWAYQEIGNADIVAPIEELEDYVFNLAEDTGIGPISGVIVMRPQAWRALSNAWPVFQATQPDSVATGSDARILIDARTNVEERNRMRQGLYLDINGRRYDVVLDTGITEENSGTNAGLGTDEFASAIYFVPLTVVGGMPVTYWQYLPHQLSVPQTQLLRGMETWYTDGGRFLWSYDGTFTCFKLKMETDPRVVLRTPHLAWKIQNVKYTKLVPYRDSDPTSDYWKDGGVSLRNISPTQYATWL